MSNTSSKFFCRKCKGMRNHETLHEGDEIYLQWKENFSIIRCLGCDNISFLKKYGDTEMVYYNDEGEPSYYTNTEIYPKYLESSLELDTFHFPVKIRNIYQETLNALKNDLFILSAGGLRTIIEAICNHLKIKNSDLSTKIDLLSEKGYLNNNEAKRLHSIRFLGNDALHQVDIPKSENVFALLDIVNHLLENLFIQDKKIVKGMRIIDEYIDFKNVIINNIEGDMIGKSYSLNDLLGKSRRLVKSKLIDNFEYDLDNEISEEKFKYLKIIEGSDKKYTVVEIPDIYDLPFDNIDF